HLGHPRFSRYAVCRHRPEHVRAWRLRPARLFPQISQTGAEKLSLRLSVGPFRGCRREREPRRPNAGGAPAVDASCVLSIIGAVGPFTTTRRSPSAFLSGRATTQKFALRTLARRRHVPFVAGQERRLLLGLAADLCRDRAGLGAGLLVALGLRVAARTAGVLLLETLRRRVRPRADKLACGEVA